MPVIRKTPLSFVMVPLTIFSLFLTGCGGSPKAVLFTPPGPPAAIALSISPSAVKPGQSATLTWSSENATACEGSGSWSGSQTTSGSITVMLQGTTAQTYILLCTGTGRAAQNTVTLAPSPEAGACTTGQAIATHPGKRSTQRRRPHSSPS